MEEKTQLEYAKMLEIPVNTCNVVVKKSKKRKKKATEADALKQQVVDSVNARLAAAPCPDAPETLTDTMPESAEFSAEAAASEPAEAAAVAAADVPAETLPAGDEEEYAFPAESVPEKRGLLARLRANRAGRAERAPGEAVAEDGKRRFNIVMAEFAVIVALVAVIFLTNVFMPSSGINTLIRAAFGTQEEQAEDVRDYTQFTAESPVRSGETALEDGVMTFSGKGTLYAPCDGIISKIVEDAGKKAVEIEHSKKFKTVISGVDFAYYTVGDTVYQSLPVAFVDGGTATVALYNDGVLVSNYLIDNGNIVWQS